MGRAQDDQRGVGNHEGTHELYTCGVGTVTCGPGESHRAEPSTSRCVLAQEKARPTKNQKGRARTKNNVWPHPAALSAQFKCSPSLQKIPDNSLSKSVLDPETRLKQPETVNRAQRAGADARRRGGGRPQQNAILFERCCRTNAQQRPFCYIIVRC